MTLRGSLHTHIPSPSLQALQIFQEYLDRLFQYTNTLGVAPWILFYKKAEYEYISSGYLTGSLILSWVGKNTSVLGAKGAGSLEATWRGKREQGQRRGCVLRRGFCYFYKDIEADICILEILSSPQKYILSFKYLICFLLKMSSHRKGSRF